MLDKVWWKIFEQTGNINAYLLYIDIKNVNSAKDSDIGLENADVVNAN